MMAIIGFGFGVLILMVWYLWYTAMYLNQMAEKIWRVPSRVTCPTSRTFLQKTSSIFLASQTTYIGITSVPQVRPTATTAFKISDTTELTQQDSFQYHLCSLEGQTSYIYLTTTRQISKYAAPNSYHAHLSTCDWHCQHYSTDRMLFISRYYFI